MLDAVQGLKSALETAAVSGQGEKSASKVSSMMQTLSNIEKAIRESPLQLNPKIEGQEVLVPVPRRAS